MRHHWFASILLAVGPLALGLGEQFPGRKAEAKAPDGRRALVWMAPDQTPSGRHRLCLRDLSGAVHTVREFDRWVRIAWAPDSLHFAVIDGVGSDASESWIYPASLAAPASVWELLLAQHRSVVEPLTRGAHHQYVEADRWLDSTTMSVRLWGYGGPRPFDRRFPIRLPK